MVSRSMRYLALEGLADVLRERFETGVELPGVFVAAPAFLQE